MNKSIFTLLSTTILFNSLIFASEAKSTKIDFSNTKYQEYKDVFLNTEEGKFFLESEKKIK